MSRMTNQTKALVSLFLRNCMDLFTAITYLEDNIAEEYFGLRVINTLFNLQDEMSAIKSCESPIEQLLYINLMSEESQIVPFIRVTPQKEFTLGNKKYRADLHLSSNDNPLGVVVECDGHDFHEKTKAQAARDKARDRAFQVAGIPIIHFTGSEIFKNPSRCANEAIDLFLKLEQKAASRG